MIFKEETLGSERIYEGKILNLRKDKVTVKTGTSYREIVEHNGGAVVAPFIDKNKIVMVKQYRKAIEDAILEVPAGKMEKGEDPFETVKRELEEETGYSARNVELLTAMYPSVGYTNEKLYIYIATDLVKGKPHPDENEELDILEMDFDSLYEDVISGKIEDAKTIIAVMMSKAWWEKK